MTWHTGNLLIARPTLRDPFFSRSVVLLLNHSTDGAFGMVLNRPTQVPELPVRVFVGGPCKLEGFLLIHGVRDWHTDPERPEGDICPGVYRGNLESFQRVTENETPPTDRFRIFTGYAGWDAGQLESELNAGAWIVLPGHGDVIFGTPPEELWERLAPTIIPGPSLN